MKSTLTVPVILLLLLVALSCQPLLSGEHGWPQQAIELSTVEAEFESNDFEQSTPLWLTLKQPPLSVNKQTYIPTQSLRNNHLYWSQGPPLLS